MQQLTQCPFCRGHIKPYWHSASIFRCASCHLLVRNPLPSAVKLDELYTVKWTDPDAYSSETGDVDASLARQYVRALAGSICRPNLAGLRILDFGAGKGAFVNALVEDGADALGVEPYGFATLAAAARAPVFSTLQDMPPEPLDGITCMDVVEHLPAPWETLKELRARLKSSGWLLVSTPNPRGLNARILGAKWREVEKAGHIIFMPSDALSKMLTWAGFSTVEAMNWSIDYGGGPLMRSLHYFTTALGVHGAVRLLARK